MGGSGVEGPTADAPSVVTPPEDAAGRSAGAPPPAEKRREPREPGHAQLASEGRYDQAIKALSHRLVQHPNDVVMLLSRASSFLKIAEGVSSRPASEADMDRQSGPGDSHTLAGLALRDIVRALGTAACTPDQMINAHLFRGHAHFIMEDYSAAMDAYSDGLTFDPMQAELLSCVRRARMMTQDRRRCLKRKGAPATAASAATGGGAAVGGAPAPHLSEGDGAAAESSSGSAHHDSGRASLTCALCKKLLYDPVTAPTGNSFCRYCLQRALAENPVCPVTQKVIHMNARKFPVRVLATALAFWRNL